MKTLPVLDHGYVKLLNIAGPTRRPHQEYDASDVDVANSARMSFGQNDLSRSYEIEMKLNRYLLENSHMTPFECIEVWLEMKLPIFVARQFVRHRTASINEISGRYVELPKEWYIPEIVGAAPTNGAKQGQEDTLSVHAQLEFQVDLEDSCSSSYERYLKHIANGVAKEHARLFLHVNHYTVWSWKQDLRNIFHFLALRMDSHAQVEARSYAEAIVSLLDKQIPGLVALFHEIIR
jgi:thymidylate synthase (FAD)